MTGSQLLGIVAAIYLCGALIRWMLVIYAPPSRRSQAKWRAMRGLIAPVVWGALAALFAFQVGGVADARLPAWVAVFAVFGGLIMLGILIFELARARKTHLAQRQTTRTDAR